MTGEKETSILGQEKLDLFYWNLVLERAPEFAHPFESHHDAAAFMVYRMYYFLQAINPYPQADWRLLELRGYINWRRFNEAIWEAQSIYTEDYFRLNPQAPLSILDKLTPLANEAAKMPAFGRLAEIKRRLREKRTPELVAERRLIKFQAWQGQLKNIRAKLTRQELTERKKTRLERDLRVLERRVVVCLPHPR